MKSPHFYFYRRPRKLDYLPWLLIAVAAGILAMQFNQYQKMQTQQQALSAKLQSPPSLSHLPPAQELSKEALERYQALGKIVAQLNQPILSLQEKLATINMPNIALLSIEQGETGQKITLTVEAKDEKTLRDYWRKLNTLPKVSALLSERTQRKEPGYTVIRAVFALEEK